MRNFRQTGFIDNMYTKDALAYMASRAKTVNLEQENWYFAAEAPWTEVLQRYKDFRQIVAVRSRICPLEERWLIIPWIDKTSERWVAVYTDLERPVRRHLFLDRRLARFQ